jgi:hypothetical protein
MSDSGQERSKANEVVAKLVISEPVRRSLAVYKDQKWLMPPFPGTQKVPNSRRLPQLPHERVLAPVAPDDQNFHRRRNNQGRVDRSLCEMRWVLS